MLIVRKVIDNKIKLEEIAVTSENKSMIMDELEERTIDGLTKNETNLIMGWYSKTSNVLMLETMPAGEAVLHREYRKPTGTDKYFAICYYDKDNAHSIIPVKNPRLLRELKDIEVEGNKKNERHKNKVKEQIELAENYLKFGNSEKLRGYFESYIADSKKYLNS